MKLHWSQEKKFKNAVNDVLFTCKQRIGRRFVNFIDEYKLDLSDFAGVCDVTLAHVQFDIAPRCTMFKVGITENPLRRWTMLAREFDSMMVVYAAPTSKTRIFLTDGPEKVDLKLSSSGALEIKLCSVLNSHPKSCNRLPGGEHPSEGWPHFTYVAWAD